MTEFKIGDQVRVKPHSRFYQLHKNEVGRIKHITRKEPRLYTIKFNFVMISVKQDELEEI